MGVVYNFFCVGIEGELYTYIVLCMICHKTKIIFAGTIGITCNWHIKKYIGIYIIQKTNLITKS